MTTDYKFCIECQFLHSIEPSQSRSVHVPITSAIISNSSLHLWHRTLSWGTDPNDVHKAICDLSSNSRFIDQSTTGSLVGQLGIAASARSVHGGPSTVSRPQCLTRNDLLIPTNTTSKEDRICLLAGLKQDFQRPNAVMHDEADHIFTYLNRQVASVVRDVGHEWHDQGGEKSSRTSCGELSRRALMGASNWLSTNLFFPCGCFAAVLRDQSMNANSKAPISICGTCGWWVRNCPGCCPAE